MDGSVVRRFLLGLAPWVAAVLLWYGVRWSGFVNESLIPAPHRVAAKFVELLLHEGLLYDIYASTRRVFLGVALGILVAVPVGFALGWYRPARTFADPMINFFRALPPIALIPLVIVYFGIDEIAKLVILFYASFFSGVIVMYEGVSQIAPLLPTAILIIPFVHVMHVYGLSDSLWAVVAAYVAFATPYAVLILHQYGKLLPMELDECARIDGASPVQIYLRIYLPLMTPALVAVGVYALLLAWNDYLYQFMLLSSTRNMTVAAAIDQFFDSDEAPWNYMMAVALVYSLPPIAIYFVLRRFTSFDRVHT